MDKAADPREDKRNTTYCQFMQSRFRQITRLLLSAIVLALLLGCSCAPSGESVPRSAKGSSADLLLLSSVGRIYTFNINSETLTEVQTPNGTGALQPCWSPDRKTIAYASGKMERTDSSEYVDPQSMGIWLMDAEGHEHRELVRIMVSGNGGLFWSPVGNVIYAANALSYTDLYTDYLCSVDMSGELTQIRISEREEPGGHSNRNLTFSISPDGTHFAYPTEEGKAILVSPFNGSTIGEAVATFQLERPSEWSEGPFGILVQPVWINSDELIVVDDETRLLKGTAPDGKELEVPRRYQSTIWRWNFRTDNKEMLAQSEPWETFWEQSPSPKGDAVAFLYATICLDPGDMTREFEPGKEPEPAILDLQTGKIERLQVAPKKVVWLILDLNWSAQ